MRKGINSSEMQKNNRVLVFKTILEHGSITRTELASELNLQKATITNIINDFYDMKIVSVDGDAAAGRRGEKIRLDLDDIFTLSIGITRKDYQIGIYTLYGRRDNHVRYFFQKGESLQSVVDKLKKDALELLEQYGGKKVIGVCLAVPGLFINRPEKNEEIFMVSEFEELSHINIKKELEDVLQKKILIKHDAKLSAYAEWKCARETRGNDKASLAVVRSRGFGLGVGLVVNGGILNGHMGLAGEVGYMGINYHGKYIDNKNMGSFDYNAATESACRYMLERLYEFPESNMTENTNYYELLEEYKKGDPLATWAIEKMAWMLGYGISNIIYTVNPDVIIIDVDYPKTEHFLAKVKESVRRCIPEYVADCTVIRFSKLNEDSFLLGGYYYTLESLYKQDLLEIIRQSKEQL